MFGVEQLIDDPQPLLYQIAIVITILKIHHQVGGSTISSLLMLAFYFPITT
jgi:hypothetical protein